MQASSLQVMKLMTPVTSTEGSLTSSSLEKVAAWPNFFTVISKMGSCPSFTWSPDSVASPRSSTWSSVSKAIFVGIGPMSP